MKFAQLLGGVEDRSIGGLLGKTAQFVETVQWQEAGACPSCLCSFFRHCRYEGWTTSTHFWRWVKPWVTAQVKFFGWPAGGMMDRFVGSAHWYGFLRNFCIGLGDSQLGWFQNCAVQTAWRATLSSTQFWAIVLGHWGLRLHNAA